ncbi:hypothetical protein GF326_08040 [Candidatus Bathyarchaeota archaeon]|nr:hypothetical protein [Candidatus Bathyarchaeota archaeon]
MIAIKVYCKECGVYLGETEKHLSLPTELSALRFKNGLNLTKCPKCGRRLSDQFRVKVPEENDD